MKNVFMSVLLGLFVACTTETVVVKPAPQAVPTDEKVEEDAGPATCEAQLGGDCGSCMKSSCCEALTACEGDPSCTACVTGKDTDACEKTSATHERVDAYLTCKGGSCASSCIPATDAGTCTGLLDGVVSTKCAACMVASCCSEVASCHGASVCWDGCFTNHDETKCHGDADAHALYHAMGACVSSRCDDACSE